MSNVQRLFPDLDLLNSIGIGEIMAAKAAENQRDEARGESKSAQSPKSSASAT